MPKNADSLNRSLFELLHSKGLDPTMLSTAGKEIPTPEEAEVFQFNFVKDGEDYGTVTISIDGLHKLVIYFSDDIANSEKEESEAGDVSWYRLLNQLKKFAQKYQLSFELRNVSNLKHDMAKREYMKKKESIAEGYYPMGRKASYSDAVPSVKIVLQHTRQIEEGEQRYRNIAKIFLENEHGERFLAPTTKPGIARVYARHIAEGGQPHDEKWNHIGSLCEEYQKMAGFVRATRSGQFNESTQKLIAEGINHYQALRESLGRLAGHRGYNAYFESWTPPLMEDDTDTSNINELFVQETVDPRIESVMPILSKLHKKISEMSEVNELSEWADKLIEGDEDIEDNEAEDAADNAEELTEAPGAETLAHDEENEESNLKAFDLSESDDYNPVASAITRRIIMQRPDLLKKFGPVAVTQAIDDIADFVGDVDEIGSSDVSGWIKQVEQSLGGNALEEALDPEKKQRLDSLIDLYTDATDPEYMGDDDYEDIIAQIRAEFGDKTADSVANGPSMHFPRPGHSMGHDDLEFKQMRKTLSPNRITKVGKLHKQDNDAMKRDIKSKLGVEEGFGDAIKKGVKALDRIVTGGDKEDLLANLRKSAGLPEPMAVPNKEKEVDEGKGPLGQGDLGLALNTLRGSWSGWEKDDSTDPDIESYWFDDGEGNYYASGRIEHNLKTGEITIDYEGEYGEEVKGTFDSVGAAMNALRGGYPGSHGGKAPKHDTLANKTLAGPDDLYKTDRAGKKGTLTKARMDGMKASSQYTMRGGPKGPLPESEEFAGDYATGEAGQWRNKGPKAHKPATIGDLVGEAKDQGQNDLDAIKRLMRK